MKIAVLDIGTNSIHLLVVQIHADTSYEILGHEREMVRLGRGSFDKHALKPDAWQSALHVLERYVKIAKKAKADRILAVATSAVREARNGPAFAAQVRRKTGVSVRIVSGKEEGRLIALGAVSAVETGGKKAVVMDIGGGSLELALVDRGGNEFLESYPLGSLRLTERFLSKDTPSKKELRRLERHAEKILKKDAAFLRKSGFSMVIGASGTLLNLASMAYEDSEREPLKQANHYELHSKDLERIYIKISKLSKGDRAHFPGLDPSRADTILAGASVARLVMRLLKADRMVMADKGIREGVILDFIRSHPRRFRAASENLSLRERSVLELARRFACNEAHALQVAKLAVRLFEDTVRLHKLGKREKEILWFGALVHDVGQHVSFKRHHKHGHYLIRHSDLDGFTSDEIEMMAELALFHRKKVDHRGARVSRFSGSKRRAVLVLASLLRVADGLDRSHGSAVRSVACKIGRGSVRVRIAPRRDVDLEIWQAEERADLFKKLFGRKLVFGIGPVPRRKSLVRI